MMAPRERRAREIVVMPTAEMSVAPTDIPGLLVIQMKEVTDERGTVREFYRQSSWRAGGLPDLGPWVQVNLTETRRGALR